MDFMKNISIILKEKQKMGIFPF